MKIVVWESFVAPGKGAPCTLTVTPCWMVNDTEGQEKQRDYIIQKANILCFQGPIAMSAPQQSVHWQAIPTARSSFDVIPEMILEFVKFSFHLISG